MQIGNHFGKRKPSWNFFTEQYHHLLDSTSNLIVKLLLVSMAVQLLFFAPIVYWIFQNYNLIQTLVPTQFNMQENFDFEKKWIVFLIVTCVAATSLWNAFLWLYVFRKNVSRRPEFNDPSLSPGEPADQRLAS